MKKFKHVNGRLINLPVPITQLQQIQEQSYFMDQPSTPPPIILKQIKDCGKQVFITKYTTLLRFFVYTFKCNINFSFFIIHV